MENSFLIHWSYLLAAVVVLWFPRPWMKYGRLFRRQRKQRETFEKFAQQGGRDPDDKSVKLGRELANKRNYLDFFRGLIGGYALWHYSLETDIPESQWIVLSAGGAVVLAGVLIQSVRLGGRVTFFAPIFYLAGLVIAHGNPFVGGFAFLLTCALNPLLSNPGRFLTCFALLLMPFGWFLEGDLLEVLLDAALLLSVPVLSLLAGRPVVIFTKKAELA